MRKREKRQTDPSAFPLEKARKPIYKRIWFWAILVVVGLFIAIPTPDTDDQTASADAARTVAAVESQEDPAPAEETPEPEPETAPEETAPDEPEPQAEEGLTEEGALTLAWPVALQSNTTGNITVDKASGEVLDSSEDAYVVAFSVSDWYEGEEIGGYWAAYWVSRHTGEVRHVLDLQDDYQPGMVDLATGAVVDTGVREVPEPEPEQHDYILNTNTMRFHRPDCASVSQMSEKNKQAYTGTREDLIAQGYDPCDNCAP